jgi:hypothetical protein
MIIIDGNTYDVNIKIVGRKIDVLDKSAFRAENGMLYRELIGVYYNYSLECGMSSHNVSAYAALFLKLSEPVDFHTVIIPGAPEDYKEFSCYFANVNDEVTFYEEGGRRYFRNLSFSVISRSPTRIP